MNENEITTLFRINTIRYDVVEGDLDNTNIMVGFTDKVSEFNINNEKNLGSFKLTRRVEFDPNVLYVLEITIDFKVEFVDDFNYEEFDFEQNAENLIHSTSAMGHLVNLIGNITSAQGNPPVITTTDLVIIS